LDQDQKLLTAEMEKFSHATLPPLSLYL